MLNEKKMIWEEIEFMRIAFVGKGGSGKTTLASLFCRYLAYQHMPVLAIDADINQHLGLALGLTESEAASIAPLGLEIDRIKTYLRGSNPRVPANAVMVKTTPPGNGSRLLRMHERNPIFSYFERAVDGVRLLATGPFSHDDLGLKCYHSKVGAVELLLNHLIDGHDEYVVVDMTAGADSFASGLFSKFDLTFLVAEPTTKSVGVYKQYTAYAQEYDVAIKVIGNKIETNEDLAFLRGQVNNDILTWIERSTYVRSMEKGTYLPFRQLEVRNKQAFALMKREVDMCEKDWEKYECQTVEFHRKNALSWANAATGEDLTRQIDPDYRLISQVYQPIAEVV